MTNGTIVGRCFPRHRAKEFRRFLDTVAARVPADVEVHIVIDNAGSHKTKLHPRLVRQTTHWHVHFTPTSASWLNQVERFFALLTERQIGRGTHHSTTELDAAIQAYIDTHNADQTFPLDQVGR